MTSKKNFYSAGLLLPAILLCKPELPAHKLSGYMSSANYQHYQWNEVVKPGSGRFPEKWEEGKWPMGLMPVTAFGDKLWMFGQNKSWCSPDGINWTAFSKTDWSERHGMAFVFFKNKMWMFGGMRSWDDFRNDIWSSADVKKWENPIETAPWQKRRGHNVVEFKNRLWLIGGAVSSGRPDKTPDKFLNDVWSSPDGINWTLELETAPWRARDGTKVFMFREKLWMIDAIEKEIWNSADGKNWIRLYNEIPWKERRGSGLIVFNNRIWFFGGTDMNDVWFSENGMDWHQLNDHAPWSTRNAEYSIHFANKLWIFSGKTGRADSWAGDIWTLKPVSQKSTYDEASSLFLFPVPHFYSLPAGKF